MAAVKYIDPDLKEALARANPEIRNEVGLSFGIASRINQILAAKHWSQADLARAAGKKKAQVSRWLSGTHNFTIQTIAEIETALGVPVISVSKTKVSRAVSGYNARAAAHRYLNEGK